jgi:chorismate dehydratase
LQNEEQNRLRVAAISFLNPAPLLYHFEHEPHASELKKHYDVRYTMPSQCAEQLRTGEADLGLVPIASLPTMPEVVAIPGCTIASLRQVRSIQIIMRPGVTLSTIHTLATDEASRSSAAYVRTILHHFHGIHPAIHEEAADLATMLQHSEAALLIGDHALLALEAREHGTHPFAEDAGYTWIDVARLWRSHINLPWVAAVWAVRPDALARTGITTQQLTQDLQQSRDAGLTHIANIVTDWLPRLPLSAETIHDYLTANIHYTLDTPCLQAIDRFYSLAAAANVLPPYHLKLL